MKKLVLTAVCALAVTGAAFAQGSVNWGSISFANVTSQTNSTTYSPLFGGGATGSGAVGSTLSSGVGAAFYWELLDTGGYNGSLASAPSSLAALGGWTDSGLSATNSNTAARLQVMTPNSGFTTAAGWNAGATNYIILVGWSANLGSSWANAYATLNSPSALASVTGQAFLGMTTVGMVAPLTVGTSPGASLFGSVATAQGVPIQSLLTQLYLVPVPEPTTLALAGLGGLSVLLFRRRK